MKKRLLGVQTIVFFSKNDISPVLAGTDSPLVRNRKNSTVINFGWEDTVLPIKVLL